MIYGCNVWGLSSEENIKAIEVLQRKCIRILTFSPPDTHVSNQKFCDLNFLKVRDVIKFFQLRLVYDFHCTTLPTDLMNLFQLSSDVRTDTQNLNSIVNRLLYIPKFQTMTYGKHSLKYLCSKLWNDTFKTGSIQVSSNPVKLIKRLKSKRYIISKMRSKDTFYSITRVVTSQYSFISCMTIYCFCILMSP